MDSSALGGAAAAAVLAIILFAVQVGLPVLGIQERFWFGLAVWIFIYGLAAYAVWTFGVRLPPAARVSLILLLGAALNLFIYPRLQERYALEHPPEKEEVKMAPPPKERPTQPAMPEPPSPAATVAEDTPHEAATSVPTTQVPGPPVASPGPDTGAPTTAPTPAAEDRLEKFLAEQRRLAKEQARVAAVPIQPRFNFIFGRHGDYESVEIWNDGPSMSDYNIFQYSFLEVHRADLNEIRYIPAYYYMERLPTSHLTGLLTTLLTKASVYKDGVATFVNNEDELERIKSEVRAAFGEASQVTKEVYIGIHYSDISGTYRHQGFELGPPRGMHAPLTPWHRYDFSSESYNRLLGAGSPPSLSGLSAARIRDNWSSYLTWKDFNLANTSEE